MMLFFYVLVTDSEKEMLSFADDRVALNILKLVYISQVDVNQQ